MSSDYRNIFSGMFDGPVHAGQGDINIYSDRKTSRRSPNFNDFIQWAVVPCPNCGSRNVGVENWYYKEKPRGILDTFAQAYEENHPGLHILWKCRSCRDTGRRHFRDQQALALAEVFVDEWWS
jgi:hypothetical protein